MRTARLRAVSRPGKKVDRVGGFGEDLPTRWRGCHATVFNMSNTRVVACTRPRMHPRPPGLHFSISMRPRADLPGQIGTGLCGLAGLLDATGLHAGAPNRVKLHELRACQRCQRAASWMGLEPAIRAALTELTAHIT